MGGHLDKNAILTTKNASSPCATCINSYYFNSFLCILPARSAVNHREHDAAVQRVCEVVTACAAQVGARAHAVGDHAAAQFGRLRNKALLDELGAQQREALVEGLRPGDGRRWQKSGGPRAEQKLHRQALAGQAMVHNLAKRFGGCIAPAEFDIGEVDAVVHAQLAARRRSQRAGVKVQRPR